jgi:hypothetical protein
MDKYPLIGVSIIVVVLLVLGSLTNVVGYQTVKSSGVNVSPLFSVRTKRAINEESKTILTSDYLGKGIESNFQFPTRENRTVMLQKVIDIIRKMDDKEFNKFQSALISHFYEDKNNKNIDVTNVVFALKQLRSNTKELNINLFDKNGNKTDPPTGYTCPIPSINIWKPGCIIIWAFVIIIWIFLFITAFFLSFLTIEVCE